MAGPAIAVMAKAPEPWRVKTRLIPALGADGAARLARAFLLDSATIAGRAARRASGTAYVLASPDGSCAALGELTGLAALPQGGGDLGARIVAAFAALFARGHAPVLLLGADAPTLPERHVAEALALVSERPGHAVFGPASDGGYWCVALASPAPSLFEGIAWGTATVLEATCAAAARAGIPVALAAPWHDIDAPDDLAALAGELDADPAAAPATRAALAELGRRG